MSAKGYLVRELDPEQKLKRVLESGSKISYTQLKKMQAPADRLPRLSGALRAYGGVSAPSSLEPVALEEKVLRRKQKKKGGELASDKNWAHMTEEVVAGCSKQDQAKVSRSIVTMSNQLPYCTVCPPLQVLGELRLIQQEAREIGLLISLTF